MFCIGNRTKCIALSEDGEEKVFYYNASKQISSWTPIADSVVHEASHFRDQLIMSSSTESAPIDGISNDNLQDNNSMKNENSCFQQNSTQKIQVCIHWHLNLMNELVMVLTFFNLLGSNIRK